MNKNNNFFKSLSEDFEETFKFSRLSKAIEDSLNNNDNNFKPVKNLLESNVIVANHFYGVNQSSVFMVASNYNSAKLCDLFASYIKSKKELDTLLRAPDDQGMVPLAAAFLKKNSEVYTWLKNAGVELSDQATKFDRFSVNGHRITTVEGLTALHVLAARMCEQDLSRLQNLSPNNSVNFNVIKTEKAIGSKEKTTETPLDVAYRRPNNDRANIIKFLKDNGAKTYIEVIEEKLAKEDLNTNGPKLS